MSSKSSCLVHISHEVVRPLGGVGVQIRQLIKNKKIRDYFHNRIILAGPLLFPEEGDCRTRTNLETLRTLKNMLDSLARDYPKNTQENTPNIAKHFHDIERKFDVYLYHYKYTCSHEDWDIHLLLIDLSSSFGQHFFQCRFVDEVISRINLQTGSNLYDLHAHPDQMSLGKRIRDELLHHPGNKLSTDLEDEMKTALAHMKDYRDYDYMLGLAMAEPLARAINALCGVDEDLVAIANDYFGLPTLYFIKQERLKKEKTKTMLYVTEIATARHLIEQVIPIPSKLPKPELDKKVNPLRKSNSDMTTIGDGRFYSILRLNIMNNKNTKDDETTEPKDMPSTFNELADIYTEAKNKYNEKVTPQVSNRGEYSESAECCDKAKRAMDISGHSSTRIFNLASHVDILAANGDNSRDEILWLNLDCKKFQQNVPVISHGLEIRSSAREASDKIIRNRKESAKQKVIRKLNETNCICIDNNDKYEGYFHVPYNNNNPQYLFLKISRPIPCKAFDRDILLCNELSNKIGDKTAIFVIISHWDINQQKNPIYDWIKEAQDAKLKNISFCFINQFNWPETESSDGKSLKRDDLLLASDVSFSQSRYESFGLSQIEPLQYGTICIISGVSGARFQLEKKIGNLNLDEIDSPIIIADYIPPTDEIKDKSEAEIFRYDWEKLEKNVARELADKVSKKLESRKYDELYKRGRAITKSAFNWDDIAKEFINIIKPNTNRPTSKCFRTKPRR